MADWADVVAAVWAAAQTTILEPDEEADPSSPESAARRVVLCPGAMAALPTSAATAVGMVVAIALSAAATGHQRS